MTDSPKDYPDDLWDAAALARLGRVPEGFMQNSARARIVSQARTDHARRITLETVERGLASARFAMGAAMQSGNSLPAPTPPDQASQPDNGALHWTAGALARISRIPEGYMRDMTRQRVEVFARKHGKDTVSADLIEAKYAEWGQGSANEDATLDWDTASQTHIARIPDFVRAMVIKEIERCARGAGETTITMEIVNLASKAWRKKASFHSENDPEFYRD
ncbi:MAG: PCP reductase family protein [Paracoccaceae bacterium]